MASVISTNNASLVAQRNLGSSQASLTNSVQRLSSGVRINSAQDDAAGLGISQQLQAQATGARVSARNANDAISMVQTAEGGLQEVSAMLQRMRELATQGNNDSLDSTQRGYIATEIDALRSEINQVVERTTFNGKTLLDGSVSGLNLAQVGTAASVNYAAATVGKATFAGYVGNFDDFLSVDVGSRHFIMQVPDATGARAALNLNAVAGFSSVATATFAAGNLVITSLATGSAASVAASYVARSTSPIPNATAVSTGATNQVGTPASADFVAASVVAGSGLAFQFGASASADAQDIGALFTNAGIGSAASGSSFSALDTAITQVVGGATSAEMGTLTAAIDGAVGTVASMRSKLGAMSNRLGHNITNLQTQSENLSASMSRITDADYAAETAQLSKNQVMQQSATAMLAQANQMPNAVLSMLK